MRLHWGAHDARPDPLVGWGGGYPLPTPYPLGAYGAWTLAPSVLVTRRALILAPSVLAYRRPPTIFLTNRTLTVV